MWEEACSRWRPVGVYIHCCGNGHLWFRSYSGSLLNSAKVTKTLLPHHSAPRPGSVCPHSGLNPWAAVMGHPWPRTANPASCRVTHGFKPAFGQRGLTGRLRSRSRATRFASWIRWRRVCFSVGASLLAKNLRAPRSFVSVISSGWRTWLSTTWTPICCATYVGSDGVRMWEEACSRWRPVGVHIHCCGNGHLWFRSYSGSLLKSAKVTKTLLPHHSAPRPGSVCPHSGLNPWAAVMGHPWPRTANPASCRVTHGFKPAFGQRGLTGRPRSKARSRATRFASWIRWRRVCFSVGASLLAKNLRAPRSFWLPAPSMTFTGLIPCSN
ncbi:Threonine synthase [Pseudomonas synxantha]|nr:Threonine synthase [Pseudomonas synxantha]